MKDYEKELETKIKQYNEKLLSLKINSKKLNEPLTLPLGLSKKQANIIQKTIDEILIDKDSFDVINNTTKQEIKLYETLFTLYNKTQNKYLKEYEKSNKNVPKDLMKSALYHELGTNKKDLSKMSRKSINKTNEKIRDVTMNTGINKMKANYIRGLLNNFKYSDIKDLINKLRELSPTKFYSLYLTNINNPNKVKFQEMLQNFSPVFLSSSQYNEMLENYKTEWNEVL